VDHIYFSDEAVSSYALNEALIEPEMPESFYEEFRIDNETCDTSTHAQIYQVENIIIL
jgi:hypothetical protein